MESPPPKYDAENDETHCFVSTKFGAHSWELSPHKVKINECLARIGKDGIGLFRDDN